MWMTCLALAGKWGGRGVERTANGRTASTAAGDIGRLGGRSQIAGVAEQPEQAQHPQPRAGLAEGLAPASFLVCRGSWSHESQESA